MRALILARFSKIPLFREKNAMLFKNQLKIMNGGTMKVRLTASFELTDERPGSSYGQPVLINRRTGKAHGPGDFIEPYEFWGFKPAVVHVTRMSKMTKRTDEEMEFIKKF